MTKFLMTACMAVLAYGTAQGADEPWVPGGDAVKKAVEERRGKTELSKLAASMKPGTWAELKTEMPGNLWSSPLFNGGRNKGGAGGLHIAGWTDDAHWDSRTGQYFYMGLRQTRRFIAYDEVKNAWRSIELDPKSDNPCARSQFGHIYSSNALDAERSRFYHRYNGLKDESEKLDLSGGISYYDIVAQTWTKLPPMPANSNFTGQCIEYFADLDGLVALGKQAWLFSNERQKWESLGDSPVDGYHSLFRHNPYRHELLMTGGNNNLRVMARIRKDGKIERLKDVPEDLSVRRCKLTVDPVSGRYLIYCFGAGPDDAPLKIFEFDSDKNEYRELDGAKNFPYGHYAMPIVAFIPEYGVTMWAEKNVYLYKHETVPAEAPSK